MTATASLDAALLKCQLHYPCMSLPARTHPDDAGLDLTAQAVAMSRRGVFAYDTGVSIQVPKGFYCEVVPRSSIVKTDFVMANGVGVIDPGYRGRIWVMLRYLGAATPDQGWSEAEALVGSRIAQLLIRRWENVRVEAALELDDTVRGAAGFGSSGR